MTYQEAATELVDAICERLGVTPREVSSINVGARGVVTVELYETNAQGHKFVRYDGIVSMAYRLLPFRYTERTPA